MKASDWIVQRCAAARREGITLGMIFGAVLGIGVMLGSHLALTMRSDTIHERAMATLREADAVQMRECVAIVELVAEDTYANVRDYHRQIDELQGRAVR